MPLNSLLVRSFWVGSTKRRMMRMVSEMVNSMIFGTSSSAIVLPSEDSALTNQTTTISNTLNDHHQHSNEEEVMNDSLFTSILPHYRYLYQFYVPTNSLSSIRAQLESSIRVQLGQYFDNSIDSNATLTLKPSITCDPPQVPSKSIEKYRFDPDYVPNRIDSSSLLKLDLIYSVQLLKSPLSSLENQFLRTFGHIRAFTRFTLSNHLVPSSTDNNQTTNIRAINDNFLNFCSTTELDFEAAYSRLRQYGEESEKVGTLIRVIEDQLDRFTDSKEICLSFNGGKDCTVLLHALVTILYHRRGFKVSGDMDSMNKDQKNHGSMNKDPNNPNPSSPPLLNLLYIKTCEPFPEQDLFVHRVTNFYRCRLVTYTNVDTKSALFDVKRDQPALTGIFMGVRRSDLPESVRSKLETVQLTDTDRGWPEFTRLSPLLDWTYSDVWHFITRLSVPYCSLYDYGYTSIGDPHNTIPNETLKKVIEGTQESYYLPAFVLDQEHTERNSRV